MATMNRSAAADQENEPALTEEQIAEQVEDFNYVLGTQTIGVRYTFSGETGLVETAQAIHDMGSNLLKIAMTYKYSGENYTLPHSDRVKTLTDMAAIEPSFRRVLDMPFAYYHIWAYPLSGSNWSDGMDAKEKAAEYKEIYDLTTHLLKTYNGTGKAFYLGHWEGDWHLHPDYDGSKDPSDEMVAGMIDWLNVRQEAVDDAKRDTPHDDVEVWHYTEVCLVDKAMNGGKTLTNSVLPYTNVDYVSWSAWDRLGWGFRHPFALDDIGSRLTSGLDYIESKLPEKEGLPPGKRVWIGEYGYPTSIIGSPAKQERYSRETARVAMEWGCPFVLYWVMYCNEIENGKHLGFGLIDEKGQKMPYYDTHHAYYDQAKQYVEAFAREHGRVPTVEDFRAVSLELLSGMNAAPEPQ